jgi:hypothetical protein
MVVWVRVSSSANLGGVSGNVLPRNPFSRCMRSDKPDNGPLTSHNESGKRTEQYDIMAMGDRSMID